MPDPDQKSFHPGSQILLYIKRGMKINPTFFLLLMVSGASLISKKNKRTRILKVI
jgi:hypothetical protein